MTQGAVRVLIIDDEPPLLRMMSLFLGRVGYAVTTASTSEKDWEEFSAAPHDYSVAVLDATMTGMAMDELGRRMLAASPRLRLIAASGYPVNMAGLESAAPGRVTFLHKPFTPEMLAAAVRRMLGTQEEGV
jgi:two-component system cell cycle sensor histidine kinase/response regulator CckA